MPIIRAYNIPESGPQTFREAWWDEETSQFVVNAGKVGFQSDTPIVQDNVEPEEGERLLAAFEQQCEEDGYREVPESEQFYVLVCFPLKATEPGAREKTRGEQVADALRGHLAWRGLGTVEEPVYEGREQVVRVMTTAPKLAVKAISTCVRENARQDFSKMSMRQASVAEPDKQRPVKL